MERKKLFAVAYTTCLILMLVALPFITAWAQSKPAAPIRLRLIHPGNELSVDHITMLKFKELTEEYTNKRVDVRVFSGGTFTPVLKQVEALARGDCEMALNWFFFLEMADPMQGMFSLRFLVQVTPDNMTYGRNISTNPKLIDMVRQRFDKLGLTLIPPFIPTGTGEFIVANNVRPVEKIEDVKGLKIRAPGGRLGPLFWKNSGASPMSIAAPEVSAALQTGVVDGLISQLGFYHVNNYHTKYLTLPLCTIGPHSMWANPKWWSSLPADIRDIILNKVMPNVLDTALKASMDLDTKALREMQAPPRNVKVTWMSAKEVDRWKQATFPQGVAALKEAIGEGVVNTVLDIVEKSKP